MATFKTRIEDLAGDIPTTADGEQFLKDGVVDVVHRTIIIHPQHVSLFSKEETVEDGGTTVHDVHVQEVTRDSTTCREIPSSGRHAAVDSNSILFASESDPVYFFLNGQIFIKPTGGSGTMSLLQHGTVTNWDSGVSSISYMPDHHYHQVIMYAAIQVLTHKIAEFGDDEDMEMMTATTQDLAVLQQQYNTSFMVTGQNN